MLRKIRLFLLALPLATVPRISLAQNFNFTSGPIPPCDTSYFTATVSGLGSLNNPYGWGSGATFDDLWINITTDHPQTLQIFLTSPQGTVLLLSQFNGAGGQNYTDTHFNGSTNITSGTAPFTGSFRPQGSMTLIDFFVNENPNGIWIITVIDTACTSTNPGTGGPWTPGGFGAGGGQAGMAFGAFDNGFPPCITILPDQTLYACTGDTIDLVTFMHIQYYGIPNLPPGVTVLVWDSWGVNVDDPYNVILPDTYYGVEFTYSGCSDFGGCSVVLLPAPQLGPDQELTICTASGTDLTALFPATGTIENWFLGGEAIPAPTAATASGTYLLVAGGGACQDSATVVLNQAPPVALGADQTATLCSNATIDLAALFTTTGLSSAWTLNNAAVPDPTAVDTAGLYTLVATNGSGCSDTAHVTLVATAAPVLGPDAAQATCEGNTVDLTASFNPAGLTTAWTLSGAAVPDPTAVSATGLYTLVATNAAGCSDTAQVAVTINPDPVLGADQTITACTGLPVSLGSLYTTAPHVAAWTVNGTPVPDPAAVTNAGSYLLTLTSSEGCSATATVVLAFVPAPDLGADMALTICADSMIDLATLYPTTGLSATWTQGSALVTYASGVALPGTYQLVVSNGACTDTALLALTVNPNPSLGADRSFTLCPWQTVDLRTLFPTDGLSTVFTLNGVAVANPDSVHDAGVYAVTATNASGCSDVANAIIANVPCLCEADFRTDALCLQEPAQFTLIADSTVQAVHWDFGGAATASTELNPEVHFEAGQDVPVTLQATLSCGVVTVEHIVHIEDCSQSCHLWFPNSFTPDKDDKNDTWNWTGDCTPDPYKLMIFNRWGELIFSTDDSRKEWDGTYGGVPSPIGVYVYKAEYQFPYQDAQTAIGHITLVR